MKSRIRHPMHRTNSLLSPDLRQASSLRPLVPAAVSPSSVSAVRRVRVEVVSLRAEASHVQVLGGAVVPAEVPGDARVWEAPLRSPLLRWQSCAMHSGFSRIRRVTHRFVERRWTAAVTHANCHAIKVIVRHARCPSKWCATAAGRWKTSHAKRTGGLSTRNVPICAKSPAPAIMPEFSPIPAIPDPVLLARFPVFRSSLAAIRARPCVTTASRVHRATRRWRRSAREGTKRFQCCAVIVRNPRSATKCAGNCWRVGNMYVVAREGLKNSTARCRVTRRPLHVRCVVSCVRDDIHATIRVRWCTVTRATVLRASRS